MEFGKVEKVILLYFGIKKTQGEKSVKRTQVTKDLKKILSREDDKNFPMVLNNTLVRLITDKKVLYRRHRMISINNKGLDYAISLLGEIKSNSEKPVKTWDDILEKI